MNLEDEIDGQRCVWLRRRGRTLGYAAGPPRGHEVVFPACVPEKCCMRNRRSRDGELFIIITLFIIIIFQYFNIIQVCHLSDSASCVEKHVVWW